MFYMNLERNTKFNFNLIIFYTLVFLDLEKLDELQS